VDANVRRHRRLAQQQRAWERCQIGVDPPTLRSTPVHDGHRARRRGGRERSPQIAALLDISPINPIPGSRRDRHRSPDVGLATSRHNEGHSRATTPQTSETASEAQLARSTSESLRTTQGRRTARSRSLSVNDTARAVLSERADRELAELMRRSKRAAQAAGLEREVHGGLCL